MQDRQPSDGGLAGFWQAALDSLTAHVAILDAQGRILAVNAAWSRFAAANGSSDPAACIGVNYLDVCDRAFAGEDGEEGAAAAQGIRSVFEGKRKEYFLPYPCHSPTKKRWFMLRVTRFEGAGPACVVIAHENITAPKAAQIRATQAARKLEVVNRELKRQASELERAEALEAASNRVLERIAANELLETILLDIALLVEKQQPELGCAIVRGNTKGAPIVAPPDFPVDRLAGLDPAEFDPFTGSPSSSLGHLLHAVGTSPSSPFRYFAIETRSGDTKGWVVVTGEHPIHVALLPRAASLAAIALDHSALYEKLSFLAGHDALTEVPNRLLFQERLQTAATHAGRHRRRFAVCMLDLDRFKQANDLFGHRFGDGLLRQVAHRLMDCIRPGDTVARLAGDEFAVLLDNVADAAEAGELAGRIISSLRQPFQVFEHEFRISGSLGFTLFPDDATDPGSLVRFADIALSRSKEQGRDICHRYDASMAMQARERREIERQLRGAADREELEVHYQLQFNLGRRVTGMEALVRWNSPELGSVSPARFIPIAEETGLIAEIGNFVLRRACLQNVEWHRSGLPPVRVAVNVSTAQLVRPGFAAYVSSVLESTGLPPERLELEITESAMMTNMEEVVSEMNCLRRLGVKIAIDDFGTGYSSLSYLRTLPVDAIKIDRSFIRELDGGSGSGVSVVRAIIALAHSLSLTVVAEGIETTQQFETLEALECDVAQGYLLHRPLAAAAVGRLLEDQAMPPAFVVKP